MLRKIPVEDLKLGMHLHRFEAAWIDHPFWRSRFTLTDPADIAAVRASPVKECWIDIAEGPDVGAAATAPAAVAVPDSVAPSRSTASRLTAGADAALSGMADELERAAAVCRRSKAAVTSMFNEARLGKAIDAERCRSLVGEIADSVYRNPGALVSLARLKTADDYTYMHSVAVCALMVSLGRTLALSDEQCREAGLAGLLHDMGKAAMPLEILNKPASSPTRSSR